MSECNMSHLNEEQLILHYYGEESETLSDGASISKSAAECRYAVRVVGPRVLNVGSNSLPVPDRGGELTAARRVVVADRRSAFPSRRAVRLVDPRDAGRRCAGPRPGAAVRRDCWWRLSWPGRVYPGLQNLGLPKMPGRTTLANVPLVPDSQAARAHSSSLAVGRLPGTLPGWC